MTDNTSLTPPGKLSAVSEAHQRFLAATKFNSLDGLRAVAILAVLWHHHADNQIAGWPITARGFLGVDLFFTISGFLIVSLLLRERRRTGGISLYNFYIRRVLRILPPYYLTLLIVGLMAFIRPGSPASAAARHDLVYAGLFVSNLVPMQSMLAITWSLSVEEQFYLVVPTIEKYASRAMPFTLIIAYILVSLPGFSPFSDLPLPIFFKETTFGPILLGVLLAHMLDSHESYAWIWRLARCWPAPVIALCAIVVTASYPAEPFSGWPRMAVHWCMLALLATCVVTEANLLSPLLSCWPMQRIGVVSYGIYLYHLLVMHFVIKGLMLIGATTSLLVFFVTGLCSWLVAEFSFHVYERRFMDLKLRFAAPTESAISPSRSKEATQG